MGKINNQKFNPFAAGFTAANGEQFIK